MAAVATVADCDRLAADNVLEVDGTTGYLTALGLSTAAGLNAYIPILSVAGVAAAPSTVRRRDAPAT